MKLSLLKIRILVAAVLILAIAPPFLVAIDEPYYITLITRIMIYGIAALSLDLILGFGGMVSFGHAAYLGLGAYAIGITSFYGINDGWLQLFFAIFGSAFVALIIGAICLRTGGIYFIMITMAMTQVLFFLGVSLEVYGGDDGMPIDRSEFFQGLDLNNDKSFYYFVLFFLVVIGFLTWRLVGSRFGMVIRGIHENESRMEAIGYSVFRYKLLMFTISGAICGIAGFLVANLAEFVTPEYMHWFRSGEIMIMVLAGGMGTLFGPIFGAAAILFIEEVISTWTQHWMVFVGAMFVILVLYARKGLWGMIPKDGEEND